MKTPIKIVMADDHPIILQGFRKIIEMDSSLEIVAEANDGEAALQMLLEHQPAVAVLDINMPKMGGFSVVRELQERSLMTEVVLLTIYNEEELFQTAMELGVKGYVLKDSVTDDIVTAIKSVAAHQPFLSPVLLEKFLNRHHRVKILEDENAGIHQLTPTEKRILKGIAEYKTSREIGEELFVSRRTIETHRLNIARKLNISGSHALVKFAVDHKSEF